MNNQQDVTFSSLDPSQKNAFRSIDNDDAKLHIVHGPPGTGKSQLVVSLLERFASEDKKVLFVSQNTEALKVIERMIQRTEKVIGYPTDSKYVSLTDYCLMLYNPTHRYLKYLREQYTRVTSKQLPSVHDLPQPEYVDYALRYTKLNHEENYNSKDGALGFDQLVSYYIKYVNQAMAPEPIRSFNDIDVMGVFRALDTYSHKDNFSEFNKPRRELVLLSTENENLTLPDVRSNLRIIKEAFSGDWLDMFSAANGANVSTFLRWLKLYSSASLHLDMYKIATERIEVSGLLHSIKDFIATDSSYKEKMQSLDKSVQLLNQEIKGEIEGVEHTTPQLSLNDVTLTIADNNFEEVITDRKRILKLTQDITTLYPDIKHIGVRNLWVGLAIDIQAKYNETIQDDSGVVSDLTAETIDQLSHDLQVYENLGSVKRLVNGIPNSFKDLLSITAPKQLDAYKNDLQDTINSFRDILILGNNKIEDILAVANEPIKVPLSRIGVSPAADIGDATKAFLPVHEFVYLLNKYAINISDFGATKAELQNFSQSVALLRNLINDQDNKKAFISNSLNVFIQSVNTTIEIKKKLNEGRSLASQKKDSLEASFKQNGQYLQKIIEATEYESAAPNLIDFLSENLDALKEVLENVNMPASSHPISENFEMYINVVDDAKLTNNFSPYFFMMDKDQTLAGWLNSVEVLEVYNNDAEIVDFVSHNYFVKSILAAFGNDNKRYIDEILANNISFDTFAARIVNVLVGESFGRAKLSDKKHVTTKDVIDSYDLYLKNQKTTVYRENLRSLYSNTIDATKELAKQSTLMAGGKSTMEKFRHNTHTIAEAFPIICATPKDVSKFIAPTKALFDYVIFDEASQLLPGQAIPSIYRAKKAVVIGDPHQMPPVANTSFGGAEQSEDDFDDLGESILDLLMKQPQKQHHLKVHYRSKYNKLFEPSREAIYSKDGIEPIFEAELANGAPIDIIDDLGEDLDEFGYDKNFYKICESVNEFLDRNNKADFCILFTRNDVLAKFKDFLAEVGGREFARVTNAYDSNSILLSTVTNCQGIEGAFTIIYLHHYDRPGAMWFFQEAVGAYKRLNVSITRQREGLKLLLADQKSLWIKTCEDKLSRSDLGPNVQKSAELMKALLTGAGEQADVTYLERRLGQNSNWFDSPLTEQLYDKLTDHYVDILGDDLKIYSEVGWNLVIPTGEGIDANERNVGFRIDLGIYSMKQKKFILGIEMDGAMYHSGFDKEHSDYTRQKVLEDKGWELYRIWSTNWLNDGEHEMTKLIQKIDSKLSLNVSY
jgi:hypothetical protein